jgi:hypothetical protein
MLILVKNSEITYPYDMNQFFRDNKNKSFPETISDELLTSQGVFQVQATDIPTNFDHTTQTIADGIPELIGNTWTKTWVITDMTLDQQQIRTVKLNENYTFAINVERDRRLTSTFDFNGNVFDCDEKSLARITGAATLAGFAVGAGAPVGFMTWHGGVNNFEWIAADNTLVQMDAQTCFAFGQAAANNQSLHIFAAKALKDMIPIPLNYKDDVWWP